MQASETLDAPTIPAEQPLTYSKFWRRVLAAIIDGIIISGFTMLTEVILMSLVMMGSVPAWLTGATFVFSVFIYVFLVAKFGATPGKMIMRLRVVQQNGMPATWSNAILRYIVMFASFALGIIPYLIVYAIPSFSPSEWLLYDIPSINRTLNIPTTALGVWNIISVIIIATNRERRAPHDFIAGTVVIRKR